MDNGKQVLEENTDLWPKKLIFVFHARQPSEGDQEAKLGFFTDEYKLGLAVSKTNTHVPLVQLG